MLRAVDVVPHGQGRHHRGGKHSTFDIDEVAGLLILVRPEGRLLGTEDDDLAHVQ